MKRVPKVLGVVAVLLLSVLGWGAPALADDEAPTGIVVAGLDDFVFDALEVDYTLTRADDGTSRLDVVETFTARFPDSDQNRGMRRAIPTRYNGQPLRPQLISITDGEGRARPAETASDDGVFSMTSRADDFVRGIQVYVFHYTLENVTWDFADGGLEFYWDVNGVDWAQPFGTVTTRLHLDAELQAALTGRMACYAGPFRSEQPCTAIERSGGTITARQDGLAPYETLSMAVGFVDGTFTTFDASPFASGFGWAQLASLGGMAGVVGWAARRRRKVLGDAPGRPTIIAEYAPPPGIDALESAVLLQRRTKGIPAEILEQAVAGTIRIIDGGKSWWGKQSLVAELVSMDAADANGRMFLASMFPAGVAGETYTFGKQDTKVSSTAQRVLGAADKELVRRGFIRSVPLRARMVPILVSIAALGLVFLFGFGALASAVVEWVPLVAGVVAVLGVILTIGLLSHKPLTDLGAEARDHLRGVELFISWAEADRIRTLQSPEGAERASVDADDPRERLVLYERLLPFAVIFGQEKQWSAQLATLYTAAGATAPVWYAGSGAFNASSFASGIGSLSAAASSSSSTSGGSSGGGSAGGGGGGGGGGGV